MATIFKTIDEVQAYIRLNATIKLKSLQPYEHDAVEKYIKPYLGEEAYLLLQTEYTDDNLSVANETLLPFIQRALARFLILLASPGLDINLGETGFTTAATQTAVPASKERVKKFDTSIEQLGWDAIESLLAFLEDNENDYPEWTESNAYTLATRNFINSALDSVICDIIERSRLKFHKMRGTMDNVERIQINPTISIELAEEIIEEIRNDNLSAANTILLPKIKLASANLTAFDAGYGEKYKNLGNMYLSKLMEFLDENVDDYPLYQESDSYNNERDTYETFENNNEDQSGLFIFGPSY